MMKCCCGSFVPTDFIHPSAFMLLKAALPENVNYAVKSW